LGEIIHTSEYAAYHRRPDEPSAIYEMFVEWCKIPPSSRGLGNYCRRTGHDARTVRRMMSKWEWEDRAHFFDNDSVELRPDPSLMEDEVAIAGQKAAAMMLLDIGLKALELKNPSLISVDKAMKLVEKGTEIQRRAYGQADINIEFNADDLSRVNKMLEDLQTVDAQEVDIIEED
jgi:hypothetical protein